jgi:hypothetical protein
MLLRLLRKEIRGTRYQSMYVHSGLSNRKVISTSCRDTARRFYLNDVATTPSDTDSSGPVGGAPAPGAPAPARKRGLSGPPPRTLVIIPPGLRNCSTAQCTPARRRAAVPPQRLAAAWPHCRAAAPPRLSATACQLVDVVCPTCIRVRACVLSCAHVRSRRAHVLARIRARALAG